MRRRLQGSVTVVVGATSGVGRATAHALASQGAHLVLAGRSADQLDAVAAECRALGVQTEAVITDTRDVAAIEALSAAAVARFGRIDTWINAAAGLVAGELTTTPLEELDGLVAVNVLGTMHASRVALSIFEAQGAGVLINVSSILGVVPNPVVPAYTMSKYAVHGLTVALDHAFKVRSVRACTILPGPIDTPMFEHTANHTGRRLRAVPPAIAVERVAAAIVRCARRPRRRVVVGFTSRLILLGLRVAPTLTEWSVAAYSGRMVVQRSSAPVGPGTLLEAGPGAGSTDGGWRRGGSPRRVLGRLAGRIMATSGGRAR